MKKDIRNDNNSSRNRKRKLDLRQGSVFQRELDVIKKEEESEPMKKIIKKEKHASKRGKKRTSKIISSTCLYLEQQQKSVHKDEKCQRLTDTLERTPTDKELASISEYIGKNFMLLGIRLGLDNIKIQQIMMSYQAYGVESQIFQMLYAWKRKEGREASVEKLLDAIEATTDVDVEKSKRVFKLSFGSIVDT
ncbi:uncharacterized protein LOC134266228 isoform X1 [Saccostrea cucullata]|uniref:uncharacterized protein LOC134266228 isoform X1 n=1 Tax=Saccostrea cuccullata TaxID=36930 RepID=UPI002ED540C2